MEFDVTLEELLGSFDDSDYPEEFIREYTLMECLSERYGTDTFMARNRSGQPFIVKSFQRDIFDLSIPTELLRSLEHEGLPRFVATYKNEKTLLTVREYIDGVSLDLYAQENEPDEKEITAICVKICDILMYLHHRDAPIIHRDIKPQNVIVRPDGSVALIDFDIARVYQTGNETDTVFFGTRAYAPPEQYGYTQTDARADIYSLGILLRYLLTGSERENKNVRIYQPLQKIINKCTAFSPKERYSDIGDVKKALLRANPRSQGIRIAVIVLCVMLASGLLAFGGYKIYQAATYSPYQNIGDTYYMADEDRADAAIDYLREAYHTSLFDDPDAPATYGLLKEALVELYGLDRSYAYASTDGIPAESDDYFLPWPWEDNQALLCDIAVYAAVKVHDPEIVADWSELDENDKQYTGMYPGVIAAKRFAERYGMLTGVNNPTTTIFVKDLALILANSDRIFEK